MMQNLAVDKIKNMQKGLKNFGIVSWVTFNNKKYKVNSALLATLKWCAFKVTAIKCLRKPSAELKATTSVLKAVRNVHVEVEASIFKQA